MFNNYIYYYITTLQAKSHHFLTFGIDIKPTSSLRYSDAGLGTSLPTPPNFFVHFETSITLARYLFYNQLSTLSSFLTLTSHERTLLVIEILTYHLLILTLGKELFI